MSVEQIIQRTTMGLTKKTTTLLLCTFLISGCAAPQKKVVQPTHETPFGLETSPYSEVKQVDAIEEESVKDIPRPADVILPESMEREMDLSQVQGPLPSMNYQ